MSLYWQTMQLTYDPFMAEQANQTPFVSPKWEQQLDLLVHLATSQDAMLLVLGVSGIGKSTMMRQFIETLGHSSGICKIHGGATITNDILQDLIARHLGFSMPTQDPELFSSKLLEQIGRMRAEGHDFYLVIDNAHKLPKASLALLLELVEHQGADHHPIHIILFGGPQLEAVIGDITTQHLGEVLTHSLRIEPLTLDYVANYLEQRLKLAGFADILPFTQGQLQQIYQISGGIPAKVNSLARQLLLQWSQQGTSNKKGGERRAISQANRPSPDRKSISLPWYIGAALAVVAVVMLVMVYSNAPVGRSVANQTLMVSSNNKVTSQDYDEAGSEQGVNSHASMNAATQNAPVASAPIPDSSYTQVTSQVTNAASTTSDTTYSAGSNTADTVADGQADSEDVGSDSYTPANSSIGSNVQPSNVGSAAASDDASAMVGSANASQAVNGALAANAALAKPHAASVAPTKAIALPTQTTPIAPASQIAQSEPAKPVAQQIPRAQPAVNPAAVPASADDAEYIPTNATRIPTNAPSAAAVGAHKPVAQPVPAPAKAKVGSAAQASKAVVANKQGSVTQSVQPGLTNSSYFSAQPAQHMTLQLAGARNLTALQQQVSSYALPGKVRYFKTSMNGQAWYVAVYGNYPNIAAAVNARASLPSVVQTTKPWPRSYQSIQSAIHAG